MSEERTDLLSWLSRRLNLTEIFSLLTSYGLFFAELDTRKPLREALAEARQRPAPAYDRWPRVLGLVTLVLLGVELFTGALLALYYLPTPASARASVGTIVRDVDFGWFVHQIHFWGAQVLIAVLILRLVRFFVQRVYRKPRELTWVFAALLLLVCFHLDLTGRALPMTSHAYWESVRALEIVQKVPLYGALMMFLVGGAGTFISDLTLIRFYVLHVALLPVVAVVLIYLHFSGVRRLGLAETGKEEVTARASIRQQSVTLAILLALLFGLLVTLAVLAPLPFLEKADPYSTVPGVGPPWYLLAPFGFLEWTSTFVPSWIAGGVLFAAFTLFLCVPFLDRGRPGSGSRPWALVLGAAVFLLWLVFTWYGWRVA